MRIAKKYADIATIQEYRGKAAIDGVRFIKLKYHRDDSGDFVELGRLMSGRLSGLADFTVRQISSSRLLPGAIKAFHFHLNQADLWYISPLERMLVGLLDIRKNSKTAHQTMRFILGGGQVFLLYIPPGVAHGAANPWKQPVTLTYFTNKKFTPSDEHRLPFDLFEKGFWKIKKG